MLPPVVHSYIQTSFAKVVKIKVIPWAAKPVGAGSVSDRPPFLGHSMRAAATPLPRLFTFDQVNIVYSSRQSGLGAPEMKLSSINSTLVRLAWARNVIEQCANHYVTGAT